MNWKAIQRAWENGDREIAVRLLRSMVEEMRFKQRPLTSYVTEAGVRK